MIQSLHVLRQVLARQLPFLDRTAMIMRVCGQGAAGAKEAPPEDLALLAAAGLRRCAPGQKGVCMVSTVSIISTAMHHVVWTAGMALPSLA